MKPDCFPRGILFAAFLAISLSRASAASSHDYPYQPVPFKDVQLDDIFWAPRLETNRAVTIPYAFEQCEKSGRMYNFERAAAVLRGEKISDLNPPGFPFDDTDPYKVLEGASFALAVQPDPKLSAYVDKLIALIASAQEPDGYLYTARTINPEHPHKWSGTKRWVNDPDQSHELYDAGHLFEAAAAHYQSTGKTNLLNVAIKEANLLCDTFGPETNKLHIWPGHEIVEMGLAKLYRVTGNERYLALAKYFLDVRGSHPGGDNYHQSRIPPVDQTEAIGHAVRAGYLYSGMADVAALTGDERYVHAIDAIWENAVTKKLYLTGGIGARAGGEAFGANYELPNLTAYNETCAAVANDYWNERLFLLHDDAKYVDVLERTLYNGLLSGVSLDGTKFFYPNPLESDGSHERSPWFGCACCPGNITRFLPSVPGYIYAQQGNTVFVNLYAGGTAKIKLAEGPALKLTQETKYPWDGAVKITVQPDKKAKFTVSLRIPGWARNEPVPGNLYKFQDALDAAQETFAAGPGDTYKFQDTNAASPDAFTGARGYIHKINDTADLVTLAVNGKNVPIKLEKGYMNIKRSWKPGDTIILNLPMPVRQVVANGNVKADRGCVALQRGPIVYCFEWPDNPDIKVRTMQLPSDQTFTAQFEPTLLNGVETITGKALAMSVDGDGKTNRTLADVKAIPYYAWANRGRGDMAVWITEALAKPASP